MDWLKDLQATSYIVAIVVGILTARKIIREEKKEKREEKKKERLARKTRRP